MKEFVTQWNEEMAAVRNGELLPCNSRIRFIDGKVLYSPNCRRDVRLPLSPDPTRNLFLPEISRSLDDEYFYDFSQISISTYLEPFWWTEKLGWTGFIPLSPKYDLCIFEAIEHIPRSEALVAHSDCLHDLVSTKYSMAQVSIDGWSELEATLFRVVHDLILLTKSNIIKPPLPWVFGYKRRFSSRSKALDAIRRSRDWFSVWMGLVSYLVSHAENMFHDFSSYPASSIPSWRDYLFSLKYPPHWVHSLATASAVYAGHRDSCVGVFVDLSDGQQYCASLITWLERYQIPVWYFLDLSHIKHPVLCKIGPSYIPYASGEDVGTYTRRLSFEPNYFNGAKEKESSSSSSKNQPLNNWQDFFRRRDERNQKSMQKETPEQQKSRQDRENKPPTTTAKVYIWVADDSGTFVRELVCRRDRADTLAIYAKDEIKYDSFLNEYDCCEEFGSGQGLSKQELFESWDDDAENEPVEKVAASEISRLPDQLLHSTQPTLSPNFSMEPADEWLPSHVANKSVGNNPKAEQEILDILRLHFGYSPPLPALGLPNSPMNEVDQKAFLKIIGIAYKSVPFDVFENPKIFAAVKFIRRLCQKPSSIPDYEWDLNKNHPHSMIFNQRVECIQVLTKTSSSSASTIYMFDFGEYQTVSWRLAVASASDALMICRLDPTWDEESIALFLIQNGMPFHTLQPVSAFPQLRPRSIQFPSRPPQYQFDKVDYVVYLEGVKHLLKGPSGRVALMMGGYIWRLAVALVSFHTVFEGPSGLSGAILTVETEKGEKYFDDQMTEEEADILCGLHHCQTGQGDQTAKKSWYPLHRTYEGSGHDYRRWTSNSEAIFDIFSNRNLAAIQGKKVILQRQPLSSNKWRDAIRGSGDARRSRQCLENTSLALISDIKNLPIV